MVSSPALNPQPDDPRSATPDEVELARQGQPEAIATLMNRLLQAQGITAQVARSSARLTVTLQAATIPPESGTVEFIARGLEKLQPDGIDQVEIKGQAQADREPTWTVLLNLHAAVARAALLKPPAAPTPIKPLPPKISTSKLKLLVSGGAILTTVLFCGGVIWYCLSQLANPTAISQKQVASAPGKVNRTISLTSDSSSKLVLTGVTWQAKDERYNLVGTLRNNAGQLYTYVKIEFELYDPAGVKVGDAMAIVENLGAYQTKAFEALVVNNQAVQARLKKITGF